LTETSAIPTKGFGSVNEFCALGGSNSTATASTETSCEKTGVISAFYAEDLFF
jgi:hypothetical protein